MCSMFHLQHSVTISDLRIDKQLTIQNSKWKSDGEQTQNIKATHIHRILISVLLKIRDNAIPSRSHFTFHIHPLCEQRHAFLVWKTRRQLLWDGKIHSNFRRSQHGISIFGEFIVVDNFRCLVFMPSAQMIRRMKREMGIWAIHLFIHAELNVKYLMMPKSSHTQEKPHTMQMLTFRQLSEWQ